MNVLNQTIIAISYIIAYNQYDLSCRMGRNSENFGKANTKTHPTHQRSMAVCVLLLLYEYIRTRQREYLNRPTTCVSFNSYGP